MPNQFKLWRTGLVAAEVENQQAEFGPNTIPHQPPPSDWYFFFVQFKNSLVIVLAVAMGVTMFLQEWTDAGVIGLAILVNTILGFIQERKAYKTLESLKEVLTPETWVIREGQEQQVLVKDLVPGDLVLLKQGDKVPADGVVVQAMDCWANEAVVTGESEPVKKELYELETAPNSLLTLSQNLRQQEKLPEESQCYMGTVVTTGSATMLVTKTGAKTTLGKIAHDVQKQEHSETPLERRLSGLAKWLTILVIVLGLLVFALGIFSGRDWIEMFTVTVALAVAVIPEGLVVSLTAVLALGMYRILQKKAVVKHLMAAETLGSVNTICLDKTGTLTEGKLRVVETDFVDQEKAQRAAVLANDRRDPLDIARMNWARQVAEKDKQLMMPAELLKNHQDERQLLSFSNERRFVAAQFKTEIFVVGAPETVLGLSQLAAAEKQEYQDQIKAWTKKGWRVIGYATLNLEKVEKAETVFTQLRKSEPLTRQLKFLGLMAFTDPIRPGIGQALRTAQQAGIEPLVITGDYAATARAVMGELGLTVKTKEIITGPELEKMSQYELAADIDHYRLFARIKPSQKLEIVKLLQEHGRVVGMMGDGVNDAPALSAADIGIVVDEATEVAREASDLVLLENNFKTVLAAIEEGRLIFQNLRKIALYLLSDTFSELFLVIGSLILDLPLPITAAQILWINLIDDGLPSLALTLDPAEGDELEKPPISHQAPIIDREVRLLIAVISLATGGGLLILFKILLPQVGLVAARTLVFATLSLDSLLYVFSSRSLSDSIIHDPPWRNPWLILASAFGVLLTVLVVHVPFLQHLFELQALSLDQWGLVVVMSIGLLILVEGVKLSCQSHFKRQVD